MIPSLSFHGQECLSQRTGPSFYKQVKEAHGREVTPPTSYLREPLPISEDSLVRLTLLFLRWSLFLLAGSQVPEPRWESDCRNGLQPPVHSLNPWNGALGIITNGSID